MDLGVILILIGIFFVVIAIPCVGVAIVGRGLIKKLSFFPSKTPALQLSIFWKLLVIEIVGFTLIMTFYHLFADYADEIKREKAKISEKGS